MAIATRTTTDGTIRYRGYCTVGGRKVFGPWGTLNEAERWGSLAHTFPPTPTPKKRRTGRRPRSQDGCIYIIRAGEGGPVKVGWTSQDVATRLNGLQTGNHEKLVLLASSPGSEHRERQLHRMLDQYHLRGEWFDLPQGIIDTLLQKL